MPSSPLVSALLSNPNEAASIGMNPGLMPFTAQLQYGQQMAGEGSQTSPLRSPWQGLARALQGALGGVMVSKAMGDYSDAASGAGDELATAAKSNDPVGALAKSSNPLVRAMLPQIASQAMQRKAIMQQILADKGYTLDEQGNPVRMQVQNAAPGTGIAGDIAGQEQTGRNTADLALKPAIEAATEEAKNPALIARAGQSAAAENPALIARAGGMAAAENPALIARAGGMAAAENLALIARAGGTAAAMAPFEPGGTITIKGPDGILREVPITKEMLGAIQPHLGLPAGGAAAPAAVAPPAPAISAIPPGPPAPAPQATPGGAGALQVAPAGAAPAAAAAPPVAAPLTIGKPVANPAVQPMIDADTKELANDRELAIKGQQDMANVAAVKDFLPKVSTGWSAETRLEAGRILQAMGVPNDQVQGLTAIDPANGQLLQKKFLELSAGAARGMGAREPGSVIQMFAKAYPNLGTTPDAVIMQSNALYMDRARQQALAEQKTNFLNESVNGVRQGGDYRGLKGFNEQFAKDHSSEDYLRAAEAMSGEKFAPWDKIKDDAQQTHIVSLIPKGQSFIGPDGKRYVRQ